MATPEDIRIQEELLRLERERAGITQDNLEKQQNISNFLQQQLTALRFEKAEKTEIRSITRQLNKIAAEGAAITLDELGNSKSLAKIQKDRAKLEQSLARLLSQRNTFANKEGEANKIIVESLDDQIDQLLQINSELEQAEANSKKIADNLGVKGFQVAEDIVSAIPGLRQFKGSFVEATNAARKAAIDGGNAFTAGAKSLGNAAVAALPLLALTKVVESVFSLNKAQTEFRRLTGESATEVGLLNDGLLTSVDLIQTQVALTQQFGVNAQRAFGTQTLQEVGELTKAVGLSAEEAGNFARLSQITGNNLNGQLDALSKSVPKAFSQKQILSETANVSSDIALAFGNSTYEIGQSVIAAKQLGLTLKDINGIADGLLDIEQSLQAEFEAEVITGRQLNLERARGFALQNDIAGLTEEIKNNEEFINSFANANRIEQEAIAATLNMSRQQMADMVMQSQLVNTLSKEQRANAAGVSLEQLKQLDIQQSIETSINKITQALAGPIESFAQLIQFATKYASIIAGVLAATTAMKAVNTAIVAQQKIKNNLSKREALIEAAKASISALKNPFALAAGLVAGGVAFAAASKYIQKADDLVSPGYGKRTLLSPEGAIALNNKDTVIAGTDLGRGGRNTGELILTDAQINRIANAVREGASRATINLDGDRVSNRIQPSLAVNTRRYSV